MSATLDVARVKKDFPLLHQHADGQRLVYLDSASSSQKPQSVLDAMDEVYTTYYANVHRSVYKIATEATEHYEAARGKIARFIGSPSTASVVFTKNVTEAINLVMYSWGRTNVATDDLVVLTQMEHHSNIVPWQLLGSRLAYVPVTDEGLLDLDVLDELLA